MEEALTKLIGEGPAIPAVRLLGGVDRLLAAHITAGNLVPSSRKKRGLFGCNCPFYFARLYRNTHTDNLFDPLSIMDFPSLYLISGLAAHVNPITCCLVRPVI